MDILNRRSEQSSSQKKKQKKVKYYDYDFSGMFYLVCKNIHPENVFVKFSSNNI